MEIWKVGNLGIKNDNFFHFSILHSLCRQAGIFPNLEVKFYSLFISVL